MRLPRIDGKTGRYSSEDDTESIAFGRTAIGCVIRIVLGQKSQSLKASVLILTTRQNDHDKVSLCTAKYSALILLAAPEHGVAFIEMMVPVASCRVLCC